LYAGRSAVHWFAAASTSGGCFPSPSVTDPTDRPPTLSNRVHSLVPSVLFGVPSPALPACTTRRDTRVSNRGWRPLLPRISSLIATSPAAFTIPCPDTDTRGFPGPHFVPSSGFLNPSTVFSATDFAGLFHPAATSRVRLRPGVSPDPQRATARHRRLPPCRSTPHTHRQAGCHARRRRLRGVAPRIDAFHEFGG